MGFKGCGNALIDPVAPRFRIARHVLLVLLLYLTVGLLCPLRALLSFLDFAVAPLLAPVGMRGVVVGDGFADLLSGLFIHGEHPHALLRRHFITECPAGDASRPCDNGGAT
jgi:hypothetical protein